MRIRHHAQGEFYTIGCPAGTRVVRRSEGIPHDVLVVRFKGREIRIPADPPEWLPLLAESGNFGVGLVGEPEPEERLEGSCGQGRIVGLDDHALRAGSRGDNKRDPPPNTRRGDIRPVHEARSGRSRRRTMAIRYTTEYRLGRRGRVCRTYGGLRALIAIGSDLALGLLFGLILGLLRLVQGSARRCIATACRLGIALCRLPLRVIRAAVASRGHVAAKPAWASPDEL